MTIPLQTGLVYGPVRSRRLGRSLGVNPLPYGTKTCNFNCCYCQYGWTPLETRGNSPAAWPPPSAIVTAVQMAMAAGERIDCITIAGNGEPTLYPMLPELVRRLVDLRDARAPGVRLAILSNASTAASPRIAAALAMLDDCYMKLDAGDLATMNAINAAPVPLERIVDALTALPRVTLQAMFVRSPDRKVDNTGPAALDAWVAAVERIHPWAVHLYSLDRPPAWKQLQTVPMIELEAIAWRLQQRGVRSEVF